MWLTSYEIEALDELANISGQKWFSIRTPNYIWDVENKVRLDTKEAVKEFLNCAESYIFKMNGSKRCILINLWERVDSIVDFDFDEVNNEY